MSEEIYEEKKKFFELQKEFLSRAIKETKHKPSYEKNLELFLRQLTQEKLSGREYEIELGEEFTEPIVELLDGYRKPQYMYWNRKREKEIRQERKLIGIIYNISKIKGKKIDELLIERIEKIKKGEIYDYKDLFIRAYRKRIQKHKIEGENKKITGTLLDILNKTQKEAIFDTEIKEEVIKTLGELEEEHITIKLLKWLKKLKINTPKEEDTLAPRWYEYHKKEDYLKKACEIIGKKSPELIYNLLNKDGLEQDYEEFLLGTLFGFNPENIQKRLKRHQKKKILEVTGYFVEKSKYFNRTHNIEKALAKGFKINEKNKSAFLEILEKEGLIKNVRKQQEKIKDHTKHFKLAEPTEECKEILREILFKDKNVSYNDIERILDEHGGFLEDLVPKEHLEEAFKAILKNKIKNIEIEENMFLLTKKGRWVKEPRRFEKILKRHMKKWPYSLPEEKVENFIAAAREAGFDTRLAEKSFKTKRFKERFLGMDQSLIVELESEIPEEQLRLKKELEQAAKRYVERKILGTDLKESRSILNTVLETRQFLEYSYKIGVGAEKARQLYKKLERIGKRRFFG